MSQSVGERTSRTVDASDSDDDESKLWDHGDSPPGFWEIASQLANNSPVKEDKFFNSMIPDTPRTTRLTNDLNDRLNIDSGGNRLAKHQATRASTSGSHEDTFLSHIPHIQTEPPGCLDSGMKSVRRVISRYTAYVSQTSIRVHTKTDGSGITTVRYLARVIAPPGLATSIAEGTSTDRALGTMPPPKNLVSKKGTVIGTQKRGRTAPGLAGLARSSSNNLVSGPIEISDSEEQDIDEVMDTDTEVSEEQPTSQGSFSSFFNSTGPMSGATSTATLATEESFSSGSHKRSFADSAAALSETNLTASPTKVRRTTDGSPTPYSRRTMIQPKTLARASTLPLATSQRLYPIAPIDEASPLRVGPSSPSPLVRSQSNTDLLGISPAQSKSTASCAGQVSSTSPATLPSATPIAQSNRTLSISGSISQEISLGFLDEIDDPAHQATDLLPYVVVAFDKKVQMMMDDKQIAWGVQWELARGVAIHRESGQTQVSWSWSDITKDKLDKLKGSNADAAWKIRHVMHDITKDKLDKLKGSNADAAWKIRHVMHGEEISGPPGNRDLWHELDREQDALIEGKGRGLGLMGEWKGVPNYYGGKVQQKLRLNKGSAGYYLTPEPLEMTRSYRFARYLGSRRLLQIRLDEKLLQQERDEIAEFLAKDFVICGRTFRPFTSKEESVYLVETTRDYERIVPLLHRPVAVQGRIGGAKGMWILHPNDNSTEPKIWIRLSQKKVNLPATPLDRSHRIFELVAPARVATPSSLDVQFINNLAHNGVPNEAFAHLTRESLKEIVRPLTSWVGPHAMVPLASAVYLTGGIRGTRLQRMAPGKTRAMGLARDFHREELAEAHIDQSPSLPGSAQIVSSGRCPFSGAPLSVGRNPTLLPSDLQLVTAVDCPALHNYYDVVIFSTEGKRSLASLLAGGDMDGDEVAVIWAKWLTDYFIRRPVSEPPPDLVERAFVRDVQTVTEFVNELRAKSLADAHAALQKLALHGLVDTKVGLLSMLHNNAIYRHGYGSDQALYVAHVFNMNMDAQKSGLRLNQTAFNELQRAYGGCRPSSMAGVSEYNANGLIIRPEPPGKRINRDPALGEFVFDYLAAEGKALGDEHLAAFEKLLEGRNLRKDVNLLKPYKDAKLYASKAKEKLGIDSFEAELEDLELHIKTVYKSWNPTASSLSSPIKASSSKRQKSTESSNPHMTESARKYAEGPTGQSDFLTANFALVKASCAYDLCSDLFAFTVAFRDLCEIKAKASGSYVPTARVMSESMSIQGSFVRVLSERVDEF
ncbi:hypothetical protein HWV62_38905 [Athelia sp. TMB]|nr:hypothetical protein HWV62_38905 [Athelia sp. TMB]